MRSMSSKRRSITFFYAREKNKKIHFPVIRCTVYFDSLICKNTSLFYFLVDDTYQSEPIKDFYQSKKNAVSDNV